MHPKNIRLWLLTLFLALVVRFCVGLYHLYLGCPRILGDCYETGAEAAFWPLVIFGLTFYVSVLAIIIIVTIRAIRILARVVRYAVGSKNLNED